MSNIIDKQLMNTIIDNNLWLYNLCINIYVKMSNC